MNKMYKILKFIKKILRNEKSKKDSAKNSDVIPIILSNIRKDIVTVLDIGCGKLWDNNPRGEDILFSCFDNPKYKITGIDIFPECIDYRKRYGPRGDYLVMDVRSLQDLPNKFDLIIAHHVLEHMDKKESREILKEIEKKAKKQIIIGAPIGFTNTEYAVSLHNNPFELHRCGWKPEEFKQRGYSIHIIKNVFLAFKNVNNFKNDR